MAVDQAMVVFKGRRVGFARLFQATQLEVISLG